ncbi:MAG TPA: ATP-binding protein [Chitinispirillaceae bacterium]|nr:ATP-binding protein [Chitinispirillaceae bacterium]
MAHHVFWLLSGYFLLCGLHRFHKLNNLNHYIQLILIGAGLSAIAWFWWGYNWLNLRSTIACGVMTIQTWYALKLQFKIEPRYRQFNRPLTIALGSYMIILVCSSLLHIFSPDPHNISYFNSCIFNPLSILAIHTASQMIMITLFFLVLSKLQADLISTHATLDQERKKYTCRLESEVAEKSALLYEAEKLATVGTLAAGVAHEISNPNQVITLNISLFNQFLEIARNLIPKALYATYHVGALPLSSFIERIENVIVRCSVASNRIAQITADLREFSSPEADKTITIVDCRKIIESALGFTEYYVRKRTENIRIDLPQEPVLCSGYTHQLEQVVINLVQNAADALTSSDGYINIQTGKMEGKVFLRVSDNGCGIAAEDLPRLTSPFFTTRRESGGTGLGLYMVSRIVKAHQGSVSIESQKNKGTSVTIFIPAQEN